MDDLFETADMDATDPLDADGKRYVGLKVSAGWTVDPKTGELEKHGEPVGDKNLYTASDTLSKDTDDDNSQERMGGGTPKEDEEKEEEEEDEEDKNESIRESLGLDYDFKAPKINLVKLIEKSISKQLNCLFEAYSYKNSEVVFIPLGNTTASEFSAFVQNISEGTISVLINNRLRILEPSPLFKSAFVYENVHYRIDMKKTLNEDAKYLVEPETGTKIKLRKGLIEKSIPSVRDFMEVREEVKNLNEKQENKPITENKAFVQETPKKKLNESYLKKFTTDHMGKKFY